jgi:hypothetical protein
LAGLLGELDESLETMAAAFTRPPIPDSESAMASVEAGIRRGYCALHNGRPLADGLERSGLVKKWDDLATYAMAAASSTESRRRNVESAPRLRKQMMEFLIALQRAAREDGTLGLAGAQRYLT